MNIGPKLNKVGTPRRGVRGLASTRARNISLECSDASTKDSEKLSALKNFHAPGRLGEAYLPSNRRAAGFTLAEVLAALLLMAIVIPVALQGLQVASRAGEMAQRKMIATRIGNMEMNSLKVMNQLNGAGTGVVQDHGITYRWSVKCQGWTEDPISQLSQATVTVTFPVQGRDFEVHLSTLIPAQQQSVNTGSSGMY